MQTMTMELEQLIGKVIGDLGGTANAALVIVGDRLGGLETGANSGVRASFRESEFRCQRANSGVRAEWHSD